MVDQTGGPWGYIIQPSQFDTSGLDLIIPPGTFGNQEESYDCTILDTGIYVGTLLDELFIMRRAWFNEGAQYRAVLGNYNSYPAVAVVNRVAMQTLGPLLARLTFDRTGRTSIQGLLALWNSAAVQGDEGYQRAALDLLCGCAPRGDERAMVSQALGLGRGYAEILQDFGVLLLDRAGRFSDEGQQSIRQVLGALPRPVVDQLQVIVSDTSLNSMAEGGASSGGDIVLTFDEGPSMSWFQFPDGTSTVKLTSFQETIIHEIGHIVDFNSLERAAYDELHALSLGYPHSFLTGIQIDNRQEDFVGMWVAYALDSGKVLREVRDRGDAILSAKLAHVIDLFPHRERDRVPFYVADNAGHVTVRDAPLTRGLPQPGGDDGRVLSVDGITF